MAEPPVATERHQAEVSRLRAEVEALVERARILLHGDGPAARAPQRLAPSAQHPRRADRERELEATLEKSEWYRKDIKKLRRELEGCWERVGAGPSDPRERDPMELHNLVLEKRKEFQRLRKSGEGLDKIAEAQRRAEAESNSLTPEVEDKLKRIKDHVEQQKRLHVRLQAERLKTSEKRQKAEGDARVAQGELRHRAAELRRPGAGGGASGQGSAGQVAGDPKIILQLRKDVDILREAIKRDERKFKAAERQEVQEAEYAASQAAALREGILKQERDLETLRREVGDVVCSESVGRTPQSAADERPPRVPRSPLLRSERSPHPSER